jgi:hypothetical protein
MKGSESDWNNNKQKNNFRIGHSYYENNIIALKIANVILDLQTV